MCLLGERATRRTFAATVAIVLGNVLFIVAVPKGMSDFTAEMLFDLFCEPAFLIYLGVLFTMLVATSAVLPRLFKERRALTSASSAVATRTARLPLRLAAGLPIAYTLQGAIIGTQSVTLAKSTSELLRMTLKGHNQFTNVVACVVVVLWLLTMVFWVHRMNRALALFDAQFIVPVLQVAWTLLSIVNGMLPSLSVPACMHGRLLMQMGVQVACTFANSATCHMNVASPWHVVLPLSLVASTCLRRSTRRALRQTASRRVPISTIAAARRLTRWLLLDTGEVRNKSQRWVATHQVAMIAPQRCLLTAPKPARRSMTIARRAKREPMLHARPCRRSCVGSDASLPFLLPALSLVLRIRCGWIQGRETPTEQTETLSELGRRPPRPASEAQWGLVKSFGARKNVCEFCNFVGFFGDVVGWATLKNRRRVCAEQGYQSTHFL